MTILSTMKKKNIIAIIMIGIGVALITAALVIVYASHPNRANPVDKTIADFFFNIDNSTLRKSRLQLKSFQYNCL